jgi:threonylcarbamoyladenosine tRNA methylthiotransferase MtaB
MQVFFHTFGCKVNQYESTWLVERFRERGYIQVDSAKIADVVLIHTCTVTSKADAQCRQAIRKIARQNPEAHLLITGCYARLRPEDLTAIGGTVFKQNDFSDILSYLDSIQNDIISPAPEKHLPPKSMARSRAFVKIQDGCNSRCSYCIVPQARGKSRSRPPESIIEEIERIEAVGYREVVLTGVHLGAYDITGTFYIRTPLPSPSPPTPKCQLPDSKADEQTLYSTRIRAFSEKNPDNES